MKKFLKILALPFVFIFMMLSYLIGLVAMIFLAPIISFQACYDFVKSENSKNNIKITECSMDDFKKILDEEDIDSNNI